MFYAIDWPMKVKRRSQRKMWRMQHTHNLYRKLTPLWGKQKMYGLNLITTVFYFLMFCDAWKSDHEDRNEEVAEDEHPENWPFSIYQCVDPMNIPEEPMHHGPLHQERTPGQGILSKCGYPTVWCYCILGLRTMFCYGIYPVRTSGEKIKKIKIAYCYLCDFVVVKNKDYCQIVFLCHFVNFNSSSWQTDSKLRCSPQLNKIIAVFLLSICTQFTLKLILSYLHLICIVKHE